MEWREIADGKKSHFSSVFWRSSDLLYNLFLRDAGFSLFSSYPAQLTSFFFFNGILRRTKQELRILTFDFEILMKPKLTATLINVWNLCYEFSCCKLTYWASNFLIESSLHLKRNFLYKIYNSDFSKSHICSKFVFQSTICDDMVMDLLLWFWIHCDFEWEFARNLSKSSNFKLYSSTCSAPEADNFHFQSTLQSRWEKMWFNYSAGWHLNSLLSWISDLLLATRCKKCGMEK